MKTNFCFYSQLNYSHPRTAIEAEILFAARVMQVRFLEAFIKPVHPCTGLIARFAQQNVRLLRTTDIRVGTEKKTPREQSSSGKKIEAESVVLHFVFFIVIVNKMQQSAKEGRSRSNKNILFEVFPFTIGSGKTMPFEKRHVGCEGREKINRRRIYDTLRINFFEATKQTACVFSTEDKNNPQGLRVHKHIFVGNSRLVTAMTHTDNNGDNAEQREKRYYYHSDHLGSAQFVTDWRGRQYEHIEYTPYGELWIEEVAAGLDKLPFRFTGKEMDEETGLYYYGACYLDPKYSRWLSGDPALGEYVPAAGSDPSELAGMGGVFNVVNLHLYHYAGNNPVKYIDPDGKASILQRTINDSETDRSYHYAHIIGEKTRHPYILHGLVDFGELGGFSEEGSVSQYSGKNSGFTNHDRGSKTNKYIIVYTGMDDKLTEQAVKNVLATEQFGAGDIEKQKEKYQAFMNNCNDYTAAVFKEYETLWKKKYKQDNPKAWKIDTDLAWAMHFLEISRRQGEVYEEK